MILDGNATLYVSDLDAAIRFYTEALGLTLRMRAGGHWAEVVAGKGFVIGLHPARAGRKPGTAGAVQIGLLATAPLESVLETLEGRGVDVDDAVVDAGHGLRFANLRDPDGNEIYLWERSKPAPRARPRPSRARRKAAARREG